MLSHFKLAIAEADEMLESDESSSDSGEEADPNADESYMIWARRTGAAAQHCSS